MFAGFPNQSPSTNYAVIGLYLLQHFKLENHGTKV